MMGEIRLNANDIKLIINMKAKEKVIEIYSITINETIAFTGEVKGKINSKFEGEFSILGVKDQRIMLGIQSLKINKLGMFKGATNILIKTIIKMIGDTYVEIKGNDISIDMKKIRSDYDIFEISIDNVYIRDKLLYIQGENLNMYLDASKII